MNTPDPDYVPTRAYFLLGVKVIVVNTENKILLLQRSDKISRPHGWEHESFRWVTIVELKKVKLPSEHTAILEAYERIVRT